MIAKLGLISLLLAVAAARPLTDLPSAGRELLSETAAPPSPATMAPKMAAQAPPKAAPKPQPKLVGQVLVKPTYAVMGPFFNKFGLPIKGETGGVGRMGFNRPIGAVGRPVAVPGRGPAVVPMAAPVPPPKAAPAAEAAAAEEGEVKDAPAEDKKDAPADEEKKDAPADEEKKDEEKKEPEPVMGQGFVALPKEGEAPSSGDEAPEDVLGDDKPGFEAANTELSIDN